MHIPDGFLSPAVWISLDVVSLPAVGLVARRASREITESRVPLLGVMGAFVFAAQMINFPVAVGTSSHLVGAALLAVTLGPAAASVVMTAILSLQAFVFQDGGVLALGANLLNMGIAGVLAGYLPFHVLSRTRWRAAGIFLGGFLSLLVSALLAVSELALSGVKLQGTVLAVSLGVFLMSAVLEGAITVSVVSALDRMNPHWIRQPENADGRATLRWVGIAAVLLAAVGVFFASPAPDGLERLAEQLGIAGQARAALAAPVPDYELTWTRIPWLGKAGAGLLGLALIYAAALGVGKFLARRGKA